MAVFHFQKYLNEHSFRWNIKTLSEQEKVDSFLENIQGKRLRYKDLIINSKKAA